MTFTSKLEKRKPSIHITLREESSFPARAKSKEVFPEPGGPRSNVILQNIEPQLDPKVKPEVDHVQTPDLFFSSYLQGLMIPLTSSRIEIGLFPLDTI